MGAPRMEFAPRLLTAPMAARYLGVSETTLRNLNLPRKELGAKRVYDRSDLDAYADDLPYEGQEVGESCKGVFGRVSG